MIEDNGYEKLANAIITKAVEDYKASLNKLESAEALLKESEKRLKELQKQIKIAQKKKCNAKENISTALGEIYSLEDFFYSGWFTQLSGGAVSPDYIINRIKKGRGDIPCSGN